MGALLGTLLLCSAAHAAPRPGAPSSAETKVSPNAREHFDAGVAFLQDPDGAKYEEAYREFKTAYADSPSWKILGNLGIAAMKLERDGEAIAAFEKYLAQGTLDADEKRTVERDLRTLRASAAKLTLHFSDSGVDVADERVPVQGGVVHNRYAVTGQDLEIWVRSGHHRIVATVAGKGDVSWDMDANSGEHYTHAFDFAVPAPAAQPAATPPVTHAVTPAPAGSTSRPLPTSVWAAAAATAALAIGGGVTGIIALDKKSQFDESNTGLNRKKTHDLGEQTKTFNLATDVLLGAALVGAGVTTYLYVSRPARSEGEQPRGSVRLAPRVGQTNWGFDLTGAF